MTLVGLIIYILIGALIGWIAGILMKSSHGFWVSCLLGIIGSVVGGWLSGILGIATKGITSYIVAVAGTCIVIAIARLIFGKKF